MRAVRCDACGAKAMMAAAQCPKCGHLFELRDGFGEPVALAYCSSCDSYYPATLGECKWCGTKPERPPVAPLVWRSVGAAALVVMVATAYLLRGHSDDGASTEIMGVDAATRPPATVVSDAVDPASPVIVPQSAADFPPTGATDGVTPPASMAAPIAASRVASPPTTRAPKRAAPRWIGSVSRSWVVVRAGASKQSRIVASIGPNSRVQLGETRGSWRRVRARGLTGWVETSSSFRVGRVR